MQMGLYSNALTHLTKYYKHQKQLSWVFYKRAAQFCKIQMKVPKVVVKKDSVSGVSLRILQIFSEEPFLKESG